MTMRLFAFGKSFQPPSIDQEDVQPAIVVVVIEGESATRRFQQILVLAHAAVDRFEFEARTLDYIHEADTEWRAFDRRFRTWRRRSWLRIVAALDRTNILSCPILWNPLLLRSGQGQNICEWKYKSGSAQRTKKSSAIPIQHKSSSATADRHRWGCRAPVPCASGPCACARARSRSISRDACAENRVNK